MLDKYQEDYKEFYSILNNAINANKLSHAYMFEIDDNINIDEFEKDISKFLILKNNKDKNIETLIDSNNYPNIKIIKADGLWIKKEQILEVQSDFKKESFDNNLKIYIIEDAAKLNKSSGNTLLKFLEEPEKNIVAILITKNKYSVITTIMSRCINISLIKKEYLKLTEEDLSYKAVEIIEQYKIKALPHLYQLLITKDMERKNLLNILENMQKIYNDILHLNNGIKEEYNYFISDNIKNIKYEPNNEKIIKKINALHKNSEYLRYNVNIKTILDKIIIEIYGGE
jgi:DNA polymerase III delta prime subunit